jgi:uncharacterized membrane protein
VTPEPSATPPDQLLRRLTRLTQLGLGPFLALAGICGATLGAVALARPPVWVLVAAFVLFTFVVLVALAAGVFLLVARPDAETAYAAGACLLP